jgi:hypothetical protein
MLLAAGGVTERQAALRAAYRGLHPNRGPFQRLRLNASELAQWALEHFFKTLFRFRGPPSVIAWLLVAAVVVALIPFLRRVGMVPDRVVSGERRAHVGEVDWHRVAEEALSRGDLAGAVRAFYRALLAALAARGVLEAGPSITAGECRVAVGRSRPDLVPIVVPATTTFERIAYGRASASKGDVELMRDAEERASRGSRAR